MTSGSRAKAIRKANGTPKKSAPVAPTPLFAHVDQGVLIGWGSDVSQLEQVAQDTTRELVVAMGTARTGDVTVRFVEGDDARAALSELVKGETSQPMLNLYRQARGVLREHGGYLVIVTAPGTGRLS